jgi:hypothetical protein
VTIRTFLKIIASVKASVKSFVGLKRLLEKFGALCGVRVAVNTNVPLIVNIIASDNAIKHGHCQLFLGKSTTIGAEAKYVSNINSHVLCKENLVVYSSRHVSKGVARPHPYVNP